MPSRTYVGPHHEVDVPSLGVVVKRGESIEVDAEDAKKLDQQPENWAKPNTKAAQEADK